MIDLDKAKTESHSLRQAVEEYSKTRIGIDLKEEIFAKYLEGWLANRINDASSVSMELEAGKDVIQETINTIFGTNISSTDELLDFTTSNIEDAINRFGSSLFTLNMSEFIQKLPIQMAQVVAAVKRKMIDSNKWIYKCE